MKYLDKTIEEIHNALKKKEIKPIDLVEEAFERIEENKELNAYITLNKEETIKRAKELEEKEVGDNLLFGLPIAVKDNIITKDLRTTCASHILDNFIPIYNATVVEKINESDMIIIGKTNMDEFAMGSSSRTSYFGAPKNPWNKEKISGGSSGGSATTVSARDVLFALGTDTGGSIRQPASYTGIVGMKPTYGRVSRYGIIAFASSLDQVGPMTKNVYENALLLNVIAGPDDKDLTSADKEKEDFTRKIGKDIKGMKIALPNYFMSDIVTEEIRSEVEKAKKILEENGATVDYVDMKYLDKAVTLYQIIAMGEASSNLARFDGIRYGSYLLSGDNAKIYYNKALSIRDDMKKEFDRVFKDYDLIIGPTTTTTAYDLTDPMDDPSKSFMDDVLVIPVNMAGLPGLSLPIGFGKDNMPIGLHIIGNSFEEATIYQLASFLEKKVNLELNPRKEDENV